MRTVIAAAAVALMMASAAPLLADDDDGPEDQWQNGCDTMSWQFDSVMASHSSHPNYQQAVALRDRGVARCNDAIYNEGSSMLRSALQMIGVYPLY